jgi:nitrite reductase/ring-hydroxylating ferredoxin subunit
MPSIDRSDGAGVSSSLNTHGVLAMLEAVPVDELRECEVVLGGEPESLILYRAGHDEVRAWRNVCPHAGRRLDYAPGKFLRSKTGLLVCAVHGAAFELERGECVAGPCRGQALQAVAVRCRDGQVMLERPDDLQGTHEA